MVKHIVIWKLKKKAHGKTAAENAVQIKKMLNALPGKIPEILKLEAEVDFSQTEHSGDIVLYSEFATKNDLEIYKAHPEHKAVIPYINESVAERRLVDYVL